MLWVLVGYTLAFSTGNAFIGDLSKLALAGIEPDTLWGTYGIPEYVFVMFQAMFAIITPALMIGAFAERMRFGPYLAFIILWLLLVYCPLAHMVWGGGWIGAMGAKDFAGGLVVHMSSGYSALVAAMFLGKRKGFGKEPMPPHNLPLAVIGASLLWVGWFGFNAGSELMADGIAGLAFLTTSTAASTALVTWMLIEWMHRGKPTVLGAATALVAGWSRSCGRRATVTWRSSRSPDGDLGRAAPERRAAASAPSRGLRCPTSGTVVRARHLLGRVAGTHRRREALAHADPAPKDSNLLPDDFDLALRRMKTDLALLDLRRTLLQPRSRRPSGAGAHRPDPRAPGGRPGLAAHGAELQIG